MPDIQNTNRYSVMINNVMLSRERAYRRGWSGLQVKDEYSAITNNVMQTDRQADR